MHVTTRKIAPTDTRGSRISVSDGQGTTATFPWDYALDTRENHLAAAIAYARDQKGFAPAVVTEATSRPTADGYVVTLSRYTTKEA